MNVFKRGRFAQNSIIFVPNIAMKNVSDMKQNVKIIFLYVINIEKRAHLKESLLVLIILWLMIIISARDIIMDVRQIMYQIALVRKNVKGDKIHFNTIVNYLKINGMLYSDLKEDLLDIQLYLMK